MNLKIGLVNVKIRLVKIDDELVSRILNKRDLPQTAREEIGNMLRYNVWTYNQFSDLTGYAITTISNLTRPAYKNNELSTGLDFCHPFADKSGPGPKFVVRNEKSEALLP